MQHPHAASRSLGAASWYTTRWQMITPRRGARARQRVTSCGTPVVMAARLSPGGRWLIGWSTASISQNPSAWSRRRTAGGTVASAATVSEQRDSGYENSLPSSCTRYAVRWYLRFGLSYRDVEELLAERGIEVDHVTVYRWVQRCTPLLAEAARPCRHAVGHRWWGDETYVKVAGRWRYVYRAIDQFGQVIDVSSLHGGMRRPLVGSSRGRSVRRRRCRWRSSPTSRRCTRPRQKSCCQGVGIAPTGTATTVSKQITAG
jgi:hypothetical protein